MGIGNLSSLYDLFHSCIFYAKSNIIEKCIIKKNGFLIYIANQTAQIGNTYIFNTCTIDGDISSLHIMITWQ